MLKYQVSIKMLFGLQKINMMILVNKNLLDWWANRYKKKKYNVKDNMKEEKILKDILKIILDFKIGKMIRT